MVGFLSTTLSMIPKSAKIGMPKPRRNAVVFGALSNSTSLM
jgi:hypothetical protein